MQALFYFVVLLLGIVALYLIYTVAHSYLLLQNSAELVKLSKPFERTLPDATSTILVLGDSTAVGTGATPDTSTAGRLGALYPTSSVYNFGVNGNKLADVLKQMDSSEVKSFANKKADLLVIQIGANDIVYRTSLPQVESELTEVLATAATLSHKVVILHSGMVGDAPIFPIWLKWVWNNRTKAVREIYLKEVPLSGAIYVDLVASGVDGTFESDPEKYYAKDKFHPSGDGYGLWFNEIVKAL